MSNDPKSMAWLQDEILQKGAAIAESLRTGVGSGSAVPNLAWDVGRLGAHIVSIPLIHGKAQDSHLPFPDVGEIDAFSDANAAEVGSTDPGELADLLVPKLQTYLDRLGDDPEASAKFYEHDANVREVAGTAYSELLLHHVDLIGATHEPASKAKISGEQARAAFRGLFPLSRHFVNTEVARKCQGVIHIHLTGSDGGDHWTTTVSGDAAVTTPGKPDKADFHTRAEPSALLRASLGRGNQVMALLTGQIIGYGRNPMLGYRSQNLFLDV